MKVKKAVSGGGPGENGLKMHMACSNMYTTCSSMNGDPRGIHA